LFGSFFVLFFRPLGVGVDCVGGYSRGEMSAAEFVLCENLAMRGDRSLRYDVVCSETDGGNNPYVYGIIHTSSGLFDGLADMCLSNGHNAVSGTDVEEGFCDPSMPTGVNMVSVFCPGGCVNGACVQISVTTTTLPSVVSCADLGYFSSVPSGMVCGSSHVILGADMTTKTCYGDCHLPAVTTTEVPTTTLPFRVNCEDVGMLSYLPVGMVCDAVYSPQDYIQVTCWRNCRFQTTTTQFMTTTTELTTTTQFGGMVTTTTQPYVGGEGDNVLVFLVVTIFVILVGLYMGRKSYRN